MPTNQLQLPAKTVIGLTGGFGSGCTTAAKHLRDVRGAKHISLSTPIKKKWNDENGNAEPSREDLQRLGDQMREEGGAAALVKAALVDVPDDCPLVIDGIRNLGEIDELRDRFGYDFTLTSIMTTVADRWDRIGSNYTDVGRTQVEFAADQTRDRNEETATGQQVELCVDASDVLIDNGGAVTLGVFKEKVIGFADLVAGLVHRHPTQSEIFMNIAYGSSHSSKCVKRHVGAVVIDRHQQAIAIGYNENPIPTKPCVEEREYDFKCYRDIVRNDHFKKLQATGAKCPTCGNPFTLADGPPWKCDVCASQTPPVKTNLESSFFPDKAMNWCTAIHAEVWALTVAGERARDGHLYTTTFPCFQCTEKIIHSGIREVCFTEAYSDAAGEIRFELAGVKLTQFEGVRSASFHRIFKANAPT
jgi:deoxycytidylate deaminase